MKHKTRHQLCEPVEEHENSFADFTWPAMLEITKIVLAPGLPLAKQLSANAILLYRL